jgi:hypothetical protein
MALIVKDRVQETTTTTGTGTITLAGAVSGFQSFSVIGNANTTYYAIVGSTEWEVGLGTYTSSGTTLSRDTILESSNGGTAVNFSAGTKNVFVTYPAERSVDTDISQTLTNKTLTDPVITGAILEDIFTITDGAAFEIDPSNGTIQLITLGANRTPKATNFANGESVTLMINDGTAYTITWTDTTFGASGVVWVGTSATGSAPTLATTGYTIIELWEVGSQVYGAFVGVA